MMTTTPFVVFGSPRGRTFWLSRYLSYRDWACDHEMSRYIRSLADIKSWFRQPCVGTVETAAAAFWRLLPENVRVVVVRRPVDEVMASLARLGIARPGLEERIKRHDMRLARIAHRVPGAMSVSYSDLSTEATCAAIFEHCLQLPHDHAWWTLASGTNLQINLPAMLRYEDAYAPQLRVAEAMCKRNILTGMRRRRALTASDGITIQEELYENAWPDAQALMAEHCVEVGEEPDNYTRKNVAMFQRLADVGAWQIITARSNGRMLGYLSAVIGPSLEFVEPVCTQLSLFVSRDARGLGLHIKLQEAAIQAARDKGMRQIIMRAGIRGAGKKLGVLYRRFGAQDNGQMFMLDLKEAA